MRLFLAILFAAFPATRLAATTEPASLRELFQRHRSLCLHILGDPHRAFAELMPHLDDRERVQVGHSLLTELRWLAGKAEVSPERSGKVEGAVFDFPSRRFYPEQHREYDRTVAGLLAFANVYSDQPAGLVNPDMPEPIRLKPESFADWRDTTRRVLPTPEDVAAMQVLLTVADLGKSGSFSKVLGGITVTHDVDHDRLFAVGINAEPLLIESYSRLSDRHRRLVLKAITTDFNLAQFVQGENLPANIRALRGMSREEFDFYYLHFLFDVAGAAGADDPRGAKPMIDPVYQLYRLGGRVLWEGLESGLSDGQIYDRFLRIKGEPWGLSPDRSPRERALIRLCLQSRVTNAAQAKAVGEALDEMPAAVREILVRDLNVYGIDDGWGTRLYYAPGVLVNSKAHYARRKDPDAVKKSLRVTMPVLARLYQQAFVAKKRRTGSGVFTYNILEVSLAADEDPDALPQKDFHLVPSGQDARAEVRAHAAAVAPARLPAIESLRAIPGERLVFVAAGGGSDVIQAALLAERAKAAGKEVLGLVSVRNIVSGSQGPSGRQGMEWRLENAGTVADGVYTIRPDTREATGAARFLENLPAGDFVTHLVFDDKRESGQFLRLRLRQALARFTGVDTVVLVDTGGDSLFPVAAAENERATPDQDRRVLEAAYQDRVVEGGRWNLLTAIVAPGIDSPPDATRLLRGAGARWYRFDEAETAQLLARYRGWRMDGSHESFDPARVGLTPLAFQDALRGHRGYRALPVPLSLVSDPRNPWNPFVCLDDSMVGMVLLDTERQLEAIGALAPRRP